MMPPISIFAGLVALIALCAALMYRRVWTAWRARSQTPTGFGVLLSPFLLAAAVMSQAPTHVIVAWTVVTLAAAIYWLDDLRGLSARLRMTVSFFTGAAIGVCFVSHETLPSPLILMVLAVASGVLNVVLTNIVNFYDGADLNLATFIGLTAGAILLFWPVYDFLALAAVVSLAFIAPFAIFNSRPKTLYLGDAGSFVFASFLTMVAIVLFQEGNVAWQVAIPLALPAVDTFYVLCFRIIDKQDLMTRNQLHLYQRLDIHYRGFAYLLPQIVNVGIVLAASALLQTIGIPRFAALAIALALTVPFYFACRLLLLPPDRVAARHE
jgi:UDP-N-acetylmuramyl pentapeptide phosphotransferase/UDP-N-acetylglucosamine-1-phosphate transferase